MGSMQDQLLKAGLISAEQLEESRKKNKPAGAARRGKKKTGRGKASGQAGAHRATKSKATASNAKKSAGDLSLEEAYRLRKEQERQEQHKNKQRQQREQEERRQRNLKLDAIVTDQVLNDPSADIRRYFEYGERIRHLYVTQEQLQQLADGELGIAVLRGRYLLLKPDVLKAFKQIAPDLVPDLSKDTKPETADPEVTADDVPEDLRW